MENKMDYKKWSDMAVKMHHRSGEEVENRILRGRALLNPVESEFTFVENLPRGPRSQEVCRTGHSRIVRRPDGLYTLTFRFDITEKYIRPALVAELNEVFKSAREDYEKNKIIIKN